AGGRGIWRHGADCAAGTAAWFPGVSRVHLRRGAYSGHQVLAIGCCIRWLPCRRHEILAQAWRHDSQDGQTMIAMENLRKHYGGLKACDDLTLTVEPQSTTAIVGPNGAGKSTLIQLLSGVVRADAGRVVMTGADITR